MAPSYQAFIQLASDDLVRWSASAKGSIPDPAALLAAAQKLLGGQSVAIVTVDMPLSTSPIVGRRIADDAVSREFGSRGCAVHSPSRHRPGSIAKRFARGFFQQGFSLAVKSTGAGATKHLVETYPHAALLVLLEGDYRVPYKVAKTLRYWPDASLENRIRKVLFEHGRILTCLQSEIDGIDLSLPEPGEIKTLAGLKRYEDTLDALVCAWVGIKYTQREARPYGDDTAAIWIPV